jgi:peptidoglycan/xylan/chitin deacetylase (PgdA/CDA1 family)
MPVVRRTISALLRQSGVLRAAAPFVRRIPRILMYHRFQERSGGLWAWPSVDLFDQQVRYLCCRYRVLSLGQLQAALLAKSVPDNAIVLTIDDGYQDFYRLAFPVLQKYGVPATLYVTTDFVDGRMWFWWDAVRLILSETPRRALDVPAHGATRTFDLARDKERRAAWSAVGNVCLSLRLPQRERFLSALADDLRVTVPTTPPPKFRPVTWPQVQEMAAHGIEIGSHTCSHAPLTLATDEELAREVVGSKRRLEEVTGRAVTSFGHPFGQRKDLNDRVRRAVVDAGYKNAVVAYHDARVTDDIFALRRFSVGDDPRGFREVVSGVEITLSQLRQRLTSGSDSVDSGCAP